MFKSIVKIFLVLFFSALILPLPVQAYLDPGTGSYIIQLLIGALLGGGYVLKNYWKEINSKFRQFNKKNITKDETGPEQE